MHNVTIKTVRHSDSPARWVMLTPLQFGAQQTQPHNNRFAAYSPPLLLREDGKIVCPKEYTFPCSAIRTLPPVSGREKPVTHVWVEGYLYDGCPVEKQKVSDESTITGDSIIVRSGVRYREVADNGNYMESGPAALTECWEKIDIVETSTNPLSDWASYTTSTWCTESQFYHSRRTEWRDGSNSSATYHVLLKDLKQHEWPAFGLHYWAPAKLTLVGRDGQTTTYDNSLMSWVGTIISSVTYSPAFADNANTFYTRALQTSFLTEARRMSAGGVPFEECSYRAAREAIEGMDTLTINSLAFLKDLMAIKELIEPIISILRNPIDPKKWAALLLWWKYGVKLTYLDMLELGHALKSVKGHTKSLHAYIRWKNSLVSKYGTFREEYSHPSYGSIKKRTNARIVGRMRLDPNDPLSLVMSLVYDLDLGLTAQNIWDLIPLSFIVDWFINIGDAMDAVDYSSKLEGLDLREFIISQKVEGVLRGSHVSCFGLYGQLKMCTYDRQVSFRLPDPYYHVTLGLPALSQWWEIATIFYTSKR